MPIFGINGFETTLHAKNKFLGIGGSGGGFTDFGGLSNLINEPAKFAGSSLEKLTGNKKIGDFTTNVGLSAINAGTLGMGNLGKGPMNWGGHLAQDFFLPGMGATSELFGGDSSFKGTMKNPYMQIGAGAVASMVPGMQWWSAPMLAGGMAALGGGNMEENVAGAGRGMAGYGAGNLGQSAYSGLSGLAPAPTSATTAAGTMGSEGGYSMAGGGGMGNTLEASNLGATAGQAGGGGGAGYYNTSNPESFIDIGNTNPIMGGEDFMGGEVMAGTGDISASPGSGGTLGAGRPGGGMDFAGGAGPQYSTIGENVPINGSLYDMNPMGGVGGAQTGEAAVGAGTGTGGTGMTLKEMAPYMLASKGLQAGGDYYANKRAASEYGDSMRGLQAQATQYMRDPNSIYNSPEYEALMYGMDAMGAKSGHGRRGPEGPGAGPRARNPFIGAQVAQMLTQNNMQMMPTLANLSNQQIQSRAQSRAGPGQALGGLPMDYASLMMLQNLMG